MISTFLSRSFFKQVNDTYGHDAGDRVLIDIAQLTKRCLRSSHIIGRYGGEEFMILMPGTFALEAYQLADVIREKIESSSYGSGIRSFASLQALAFPPKNGRSCGGNPYPNPHQPGRSGILCSQTKWPELCFSLSRT
ncbi:GGDEF domain-containing protein [Peribacillus kribbensis]|uniref:GGDEF domain-containing protein n=1 Tax=Peribacillus kribbensis TaxID=356658 RepID=UPI00047A255C|nr:GGDEF domain-containing protein [Peribacillus kribbensis]